MSVQLEALADEVFGAAAAQARLGSQSVRRSFGEAIWNPTYPDLFFLNGIGDLVAPGWTVDDFEAAVRETIPGVRAFRAYSRDPETIASLGPALVAAGYAHDRRIAMVQVQPDHDSPSPGSGRGFVIHPVDTSARWADYERLIHADTTEHGWTPAMREQLIKLYRWRVDQTPTRFFLAYVADQAVGHVGLFQHGTSAYLHALFTDPARRRRGAGSILTLSMQGEATAMGCERLTLQCSDDGYLPGYYRRLGFRAVGEQHHWTKPRR
ncbi:MAG TPA: GNAT family N-acetyltransferase [Candidatus Acidoferrum sp.]|nr:GNAT family N-acetyltransferase [Candidatus Acidoferrum sp.]